LGACTNGIKIFGKSLNQGGRKPLIKTKLNGEYKMKKAIKTVQQAIDQLETIKAQLEDGYYEQALGDLYNWEAVDGFKAVIEAVEKKAGI
jgi:hypothetical protein